MEVLAAVLNSNLPFGERVIWCQLYLMAGYNVVSASQTDAADAFSMNKYTFKKYVTALKRKGAVLVKSRYDKGKWGGNCVGSSYQLVPIDIWLGQGEPV